jgi:hypothetical protein
MNVWRPKVSFLVTFPHAEMGLPSARTKAGLRWLLKTCVEKPTLRHLYQQENAGETPNPEEKLGCRGS